MIRIEQNDLGKLLLELREGKTIEIRKKAAILLGNISNETQKIANALIDSLNNNNESLSVRSEAILSLAKIKTEKAKTRLLKILDKRHHWRMRISAILGLVNMRAREAISKFEYLLNNDENPEVRYWSAWALGQLKANEAVKTLTNIIHTEKNMKVRFGAISALGEMQVKEAIEPIKKLLLDNSLQEEKFCLALALVKIEGKGSEGIRILRDMKREGKLYPWECREFDSYQKHIGELKT